MTIRPALRLALSAILGTATLAAAETTYLPGAAEVTGLAGARFSSTLEISNPGASGTTATIGLVPMAGKATPSPVTRTLAAGESLRITEALKTLFDLTDDAAGTLTVTSDEPLLANLSTRNVAAPEGAYGLGLLPAPASDLLGSGETGHSIWVSQSADTATGYRTNLSVTLADPGTVVEVRVFDGEGRVAGTATVTAVTPQVWQQPATALIGAGTDLPVGRAEFEVKTGRATAYAVVNDNVTSDAIALQTERVVPGASDRLISGAALSPGHLGSFWSTDLRLFNPGSAALDATIQSVGASRAASAVVPVPAKGVVEVARVLALLGFPEGTACALRVSAPDSLLVAARTNNVDPAGVRKGTFSAQQFVTSWPAGLLGAGSLGFFNGIDQTLNVPGTRTNLTIVGGPDGAAGELVLRDAAGVERGRTGFLRGPGEWGQLGVADWFATAEGAGERIGGLAPATIPENARIDVSVATGALDAFVSRIDNGSGDAVTRPVALPGGGDCSKVAVTSFGAAPQPIQPGVETTFTWTIDVDPPTAELTSQSIRFDGEPEIELDKDARSFARSFASSGARSVTLTVRKGSCVKSRALSFFVCGPLTLEPSTLSDGVAFAVYPIRTLTVPGATAPTTFTVSAGALPEGLTLSPAGEISGRAEEVGSFTFTAKAVDANGCSGTREYVLRIFCPTLRIAPSSLPAGTVATPYPLVRFTVTGGSGTGTWSATGLPPGLALSTGGQLAGTPTAAGSYAVSVRFRDSSGCDGTATYTILVCNTLVVTPGTLPAGTAGTPYGPIGFTAAGATGGATWAVTAGALPAGVTLDAGTGVLAGTPTVVGTFPFTVTATDTLGCTGSVAVSLVVSCPVVTVNPAALANGTAGVAYGPVSVVQAGGIGVATWAVTAGALPAGMSMSAAGVLTGTPTVTGTFGFTATATDANGCNGSRVYALTIDCPVIVLSPASLGNGTAGVAYGPVALTQTGGVGAATFAVTAGALPAGLTLSPAGVLSGTPTVVGPFGFTVTATDANGCIGTRIYSLVVDCPVITVNPATLSGATVGTAYSQSVSSAGGIGAPTFAVTAGALPTGLLLNGTSGAITGTPTAAGTYDFTITATDANLCTGSRPYTVVAICPAITLSPATLPGGTTGIAYALSLSAAGATAPYTWAVTVGALPSGLTLDGATGEITGTPTAAGIYNFTITATDANGCAGTRAYSVGIVCPTITITPGTIPGGTAGTAYAQTVVGAGGGGTYLYAVTAGALPDGLTLDGASGAITGTPTVAGLFGFTITATDQYGCSGATAYSVRICPVVTVTPATAPQGTINQTYVGETFTQTGGVAPATWTATGLPAGLVLDPTTGVLSGTPTAEGGFPVTVTAIDANGCPGSVSFTLRICPEMTISPATLGNGMVGTAYGPVTLTQAGSAAAITWSATGLPTGLTLDPTTGVLSGTPEATGSYPVDVTATDANGCAVSRSYTLVVDCPVISLSPGSLAAGTAGTVYNQTVTASSALVGGSYSFAVFSGALPAGLSLGAGGAITGTPTAVGTFNFTIRATHAPTGCTGDQAYSIVISCGTITIGGGTPPSNVTAGVAGYTHTFTATGGALPHTFSSTGTLPTGLTLSPAGVLSGTPTAAGTFHFTIVATDSATGATCTGSAPFTVVVVCPAITVNPASLPGGTDGTAYSQNLTATGGTGPHTFAVTLGALPAGLSLSTAGALTGTPTATGEFTFTVTATDTATNCTGSRAYTIRICPVISLSAVPTCATNGLVYTTTITPSAGTAPFAFGVTGTLPAGTTLDGTTGVLTGTLTTAGQFTFTVTATDANGCAGSQAYTVNVLGMTPAAGALPEATFGAAYSQAVTASGGSGGFTYAVTTGSLPEGLTLNPATGALTGIPTGAAGTGSFAFTITATNTATTCTIARAYTLVSRPVAVLDTYANGVGNTEYYTGGYAPTPATPFVANAANILSNDLGPALTVTSLTQPANGTLTLGTAGAFRYTPNAGAETSATFTYKVTSNGVESLAAVNVTITLVGQVWYVNSSGGAGIGTSNSPFNSMASADVSSGAGDVVFVHTGAATTTGAITLDANQVLWGQGSAFSLAGLSIGASAKPTLTGTVTLGGSGITVSSLDISTTGSVGLTDSQAGAITGITVQNNVTVTATNAAAVVLSDVTSAAGGMVFASVSSSASGASGISLANVGGTFTANGGSITNATGTDFLVSGGNGNVTYGGSITDDVGVLVAVTTTTGGSKTFTGAISDGNDGDGSGIVLTTNTGTTITFSGGLVLSTGGNPAFTATGGGTVNVCDENPCNPAATGGLVNRLTTTTGSALNVANTTIGANNLEFQSVSSNGATRAIILNTTGAVGGLKVKGTGSAGSGGTIQNCTQRGAELISTSNVSLVRMNFTNNATVVGAPCGSAALVTSNNTGCNGPIYLQSANTAVLDNLVISGSTQQGIVALDTTGLTLSNSTLTGLGNGPDEDGLHITNLLGTNAISSTSISGSGDDNVNIQNLSGTSTINVTGGSFNTGVLGSGLLFGIRGTSNTTITVTGTTVDNNFSGGIVADTYDTATLSIDVGSSIVTNNNDGIQVSAGQTANAQYDIHDNPNISGQDFLAITLLKAAFSTGGTLEGAVRNNVITIANGRPTDGIFVFQAGGGSLRTAIQNNTINYAGTQRAILLQAGQDGNGSIESTITGNNIDIQLDGAGNAVAGILAQSAITGPGNTASLCFDMGGAGGLRNTFTHSLGGSMAGGDIRVRQRNDGTVRLPGYVGGATDTAAVVTYLSGRNTVVSTPTATFDFSGFSGGGACVPPTIP